MTFTFNASVVGFVHARSSRAGRPTTVTSMFTSAPSPEVIDHDIPGARPVERGPVLYGERGQRPDGVAAGMHAHGRGELSWVPDGIQRLLTPAGVWVVPSQFAVFLPGRVLHDAEKHGEGAFHWVKFGQELAGRLPRAASAVYVTPGLRAALLRATDGTKLSEREVDSLLEVFTSEIVDAGLRPVMLPLAEPEMLKPIITRLKQDPADPRALEAWAAMLGTSSSTVTRTFQRELGLSFREYRHRLRLLAAFEGLAAGCEVSVVARQLGYRSVSMFVELFRKKLGVTPGRYFARVNASESGSGAEARPSGSPFAGRFHARSSSPGR
jgi:AraC-like DNA-binding protein